MTIPENSTPPQQKALFESIGKMSPKDIEKLPAMDESCAASFYRDNVAATLSPVQAATLAIVQPRKLMSDFQVHNAINACLKADDRVSLDVFYADKMEAKPSRELLDKLQNGAKDLESVSWPSSLREVALMTPKSLSELPQMNTEQAKAFKAAEPAEFLSKKQIAVIALAQDHQIFPELNANAAINHFLPIEKKLDRHSLYQSDTASTRHFLARMGTDAGIVDRQYLMGAVLDSNRPEPRPESSTMLSRFKSMLGVEDKPEHKSGLAQKM